MKKITDPAEPTLAIVITAYNYAHYVRACIHSVLSQSRPAHEVLVVDDGSTDATPRILQEYADRLRVLRVENAGQASAFNLGFAETTADAVLFLDADDTLHPHAVETILLNWSGDMASLVFDLEIIDAEGAGLGIHPGLAHGTVRDNRPNLFGRAHYGSVPTSGNVFSRQMLAAALPMLVERWRISADCYLIRAAALFGRTGYVKRVLGQYRVHTTNGYTRLGAGGWEEGLRLSNQLDAADALDDLAEAGDALLGDDARKLRKALRKQADALRDGADGATLMHDDDVRPFLRARDLPIMEFDVLHDLGDTTGVGGGLVEGQGQVDLDVRLPSCAGPLALDIQLDPIPDASVEFQIDGIAVSRIGPFTSTVGLSLERRPFLAERRVRITAVSDGRGTPRLTAIRVSSGRNFASAPILFDRQGQAAHATLAAGLDPTQWAGAGTGGIRLTGSRGQLRFSAERPGFAALVLETPENHPPGWLMISHQGRVHFQGQTENASEITVPLDVPVSRVVELDIEFSGLDEAQDSVALPHFSIDFVRLKHLGDSMPPRLDGSPMSIGQRIVLASHPRSDMILGEGWFGAEAEPPITNSMEAKLHLRLPSNARDLSLTFEFAPIVQAAEGPANIVGISLGGEMLASALFPAHGEIVVPIKAVPSDGRVDLSVHAVSAVGDQPVPALVGLHSVTVDGPRQSRARSRSAPVCIAPDFERLSAEIRGILADPSGEEGIRALASNRAALVDLMETADVSLHVLFAGNEMRLSMLVDLHLATRFVEPTEAETSVLERLLAETSDAAKLKAALVALLLRPAYRHPFSGGLSEIPPPLLASPEALGRYLGAAPTLLNDADHAAYRDYLQRLLDSAWKAILPGPKVGRIYPLAEATIRHLRAIPAIFAGGNLKPLVRAQSRLIERILTDRGAHLTMPRTARPEVRRPRLGVLVRDIVETPESWVLKGIYSHLDRDRFEIVLIRMENEGEPAPDFFELELCLADLSVDASVQAIRELDLDLFITGAYARDFEKVSSIYAHRLASIQLWHATVCPTTGGFASFDGVISCQASEPEDAPEQYFETPMYWIEGPRQSAFAFDPPKSSDRARTRAGLGLSEDQVMLVSTAMAHKIGDDLLKSWARILADAPSAILVLAPFAPNWSMPLDIDFFSKRLRDASLPEDRVVLSPPVPPAKVIDLLVAADLFLDSWPYSGATTVCEALSRGTPVVTCKGRALRQLTGTSWVNAYGLSELVATGPEAYVDLATKLATDAAYLADVRHRTTLTAQTQPPPHNDQKAYGKIYSDLIWRISKQSGLFPGLSVVPSETFTPTRAPSRFTTLGPKVEPQRLAILANPRTGSMMLCSILNRTPFTTCHFELFHKDMIQYSDKTVTDEKEIDERNADPQGFLERLVSKAGDDGARLMAFKHFWFFGREIEEAVISDPRYLVIHLSRENLLAQHSSEILAKSSEVWFRREASPVRQPTVRFDEEAFETFVRFRRRQQMERLNAIARAGRTPLFVEYTSLNSKETRRAISSYIGIQIPDDAQPDTAKQNSHDILSRFDNPDDVRRYLARENLEHWQVETHQF